MIVGPLILWTPRRRPVLVRKSDGAYTTVARDVLRIWLRQYGHAGLLADARGRRLTPTALVRAHGLEITRDAFDAIARDSNAPGVGGRPEALQPADLRETDVYRPR